MPDEDFDSLIQKARAGDEQAIASLVAQYEPEVRMVARNRLSAALRPYLDSVDLAQSVHVSLMVGLRDQRFEIKTPQNLVALAVTMVKRKIAKQWRHLKKQNRPSTQINSPELMEGFFERLVGEETDPSRASDMRERLERVWSEMNDLERKLIDLRLQDNSTAEAARQLSEDPDVLRVRLSRLRKRLREAGLLQEWL